MISIEKNAIYYSQTLKRDDYVMTIKPMILHNFYDNDIAFAFLIPILTFSKTVTENYKMLRYLVEP